MSFFYGGTHKRVNPVLGLVSVFNCVTEQCIPIRISPLSTNHVLCRTFFSHFDTLITCKTGTVNVLVAETCVIFMSLEVCSSSTASAIAHHKLGTVSRATFVCGQGIPPSSYNTGLKEFELPKNVEQRVATTTS